MYIRRTTIKSRKSGAPYYTYRLVESVRTEKGVKQRTLLNLGKGFSCPKKSWPELARRVEEIITGQKQIFKLSAEHEVAAQRYGALIIQAREQTDSANEGKETSPDYCNVDINTFEFLRPRSIAIEHVAYEALAQLKLDEKMKELGFNKHQVNAAIGTIIGRMTVPGSELSTHKWLRNQSGLGELVDYDYEGMSLTRMYQISDLLLKKKEKLEEHLYARQRSLFQFTETVTLYDLTNTYFEGSGKFNENGARGHSKEKRSDCPLVTLGLVLDGSGFPKRSKVFEGNVSEPKTLEEMLKGLEVITSDNSAQKRDPDLFEKNKPTVVMDAGIATEDNIEWLVDQQYSYLVVSRKRHREFSEDEAMVVKKEGDYTVKAQKVINEETGEIELYCHSSRREEKEKAIQDRFSTRFEEAIAKLDAGLDKKGCVKKYDKVIEGIGRIKEKYSSAARHYSIKVTKDEISGKASRISWERKESPHSKDSHPGVYCLRTNQDSWDEETLWRTYTMLTDLESVFRSLKSELGMRPVFHQTTDRVSGHLFITLLAYHLVHTIRYQLKKKGIDSSWSELRKQLSGQARVTASVKSKTGEMIHIRKSTRPEPRQQVIYDALNLSYYPGRRVKTVI